MLARADADYCSTRCRVAAHRARKRAQLPHELVDAPRWVRADGKRPITTTGTPASSTDATTWSTYAAARRSQAGDGLGVMLGDGLGCYDLDHVTDVQAAAFVRTVTERVLYVERSLSGDGVHVFVEAAEERGWRRTLQLDGEPISVERYTRERFIRVTLERLPI